MTRRVVAVGRLLPWRWADLRRWKSDSTSGPLQRTWRITLADGTTIEHPEEKA